MSFLNSFVCGGEMIQLIQLSWSSFYYWNTKLFLVTSWIYMTDVFFFFFLLRVGDIRYVILRCSEPRLDWPIGDLCENMRFQHIRKMFDDTIVRIFIQTNKKTTKWREFVLQNCIYFKWNSLNVFSEWWSIRNLYNVNLMMLEFIGQRIFWFIFLFMLSQVYFNSQA